MLSLGGPPPGGPPRSGVVVVVCAVVVSDAAWLPSYVDTLSTEVGIVDVARVGGTLIGGTLVEVDDVPISPAGVPLSGVESGATDTDVWMGIAGSVVPVDVETSSPKSDEVASPDGLLPAESLAEMEAFATAAVASPDVLALPPLVALWIESTTPS